MTNEVKKTFWRGACGEESLLCALRREETRRAFAQAALLPGCVSACRSRLQRAALGAVGGQPGAAGGVALVASAASAERGLRSLSLFQSFYSFSFK